MVARRRKRFELLIADDDVAFRETLRMVLEPHFHTVEASSGEEAIQIVRHQPVDIALFDMHMDVLSGLETVRIVKTLKAILPCIIITGDASDDLYRRAALADAYSVLRKPVTKSELVNTVSTALVDAYDADPLL
jgi:CheY-like chemotaxis protein